MYGIQGGLPGAQGLTGPATVGPMAVPVAGQPPITARLLPGQSFLPGQLLTGTVAGRSGAGFLLQLGDTTLLAESRVPLEVGQNIQLLVQGQAQGRLQLSLVQGAFTPMSQADLSSALTGMKFPPSEENLALARTMVEHQVPLTKENFALFKAALAQTEAGPATLPLPARAGAVCFLQANNLPLSPQNVLTLANFIAAHPQISAQLFALQGELRKLADSPSTSRRAMEILAEVPGVLGEFLLEPAGKAAGARPGKRLMDLARQAGIETHLGLVGGGEQDWDLVTLLRHLRGQLAAEEGVAGVLGMLGQLEENLRAHQLINQARPETWGYYYMQVPLRLDNQEMAELWIRYRVEDGRERVVDPDSCALELVVSTQNLGDIYFSIEVSGRAVSLDAASSDEGVRDLLEEQLPRLAERLAGLGWLPGRLGASLRALPQRPLVARQDLESMERFNVQA